MKELIIFFSRTGENCFGKEIRILEEGNAHVLARMIQRVSGAEMFEVKMKTPYAFDFKTCVAEARRDWEKGLRPDILEYPPIDGVERIYLVAPNYCGTLPACLFTVMDAMSAYNGEIVPVISHEGSGLGTVSQDIKKCLPRALIKEGLAVTGSDTPNAEETIKKFIKGLI